MEAFRFGIWRRFLGVFLEGCLGFFELHWSLILRGVLKSLRLQIDGVWEFVCLEKKIGSLSWYWSWFWVILFCGAEFNPLSSDDVFREIVVFIITWMKSLCLGGDLCVCYNLCPNFVLELWDFDEVFDLS